MIVDNYSVKELLATICMELSLSEEGDIFSTKIQQSTSIYFLYALQTYMYICTYGIFSSKKLIILLII